MANVEGGGMMQEPAHAALAVQLFKSGGLTAARAAKLAGMSLRQFLSLVSDQGIPVVDYMPSELEAELAVFNEQEKLGAASKAEDIAAVKLNSQNASNA